MLFVKNQYYSLEASINLDLSYINAVFFFIFLIILFWPYYKREQ